MLSLKAQLWSPLSTTSDPQTSSRSAASLKHIRRLSGIFLPILFSSSAFRSGNESLKSASVIPHAVFYPGSGWSAGAESPHFFCFHGGIIPPARKSHSHKAWKVFNRARLSPNTPRSLMTNVPQKRKTSHENAGRANHPPLPTVATIHTTEVLLVCSTKHAAGKRKRFSVEWLNNGGSFTAGVTWGSFSNTCAHRAAAR